MVKVEKTTALQLCLSSGQPANPPKLKSKRRATSEEKEIAHFGAQTRALGRIKAGLQKRLYLGNLDSRRDWGFAGDYVEAMWMMLQHSEPGDFVVATGEAYSVRQFLDEAFGYANLRVRRNRLSLLPPH